MMLFLRSLTPLAIRLLIGAAVVALLAGFLFLQSCQSAKTAKTETKLATGQADAAIASGTDAVNTVGEVAKRADEINTTTRSNTDAIRSAEGADAPVSSAVDAVARERLCRRAAYRGRAECVQFTPPE